MYAPLGRDAAIAAALLSEVGAHPRICPDLGGFIAALNEDACFAVVTEEALNDADLRPLAGVRSLVDLEMDESDPTRLTGVEEQHPITALLR